MKKLFLLIFVLIQIFWFSYVNAEDSWWENFKETLTTKVTSKIIEKNWWIFSYRWKNIKNYLNWKSINYLNKLDKILDDSIKTDWRDILFDYEVYWYILEWDSEEIAKLNYNAMSKIWWKFWLFNWDNYYKFSSLLARSVQSVWKDNFNLSSSDIAEISNQYNQYYSVISKLTIEQDQTVIKKQLWNWISNVWIYNRWFEWLWWEAFSKTLASIVPDVDKAALRYLDYVNQQTWWKDITSFFLSIETEKFLQETKSPLTDAILDLWIIEIDPKTKMWYFIIRLLQVLNSYFLLALLLSVFIAIFAFLSYLMANWDQERNERRKWATSAMISFLILLSVMFWWFSLYTKMVIWSAIDEFWEDFLTPIERNN